MVVIRDGTDKGKRPGRVSYQLLSINQLGAVYEALLSYRGFFAAEDLYEVKPGKSKGKSLSARDSSAFEEVISFTRYYPYHQQSPIAAYLIPKGLKGRTPVIVVDPIEDIVGWRWNQGDSQRATNVPGYVEFNRVVLEPRAVEVCEVMG
jgi:hypothetical protein